MNIGLYRPTPLPFSIEKYIEILMGELSAKGVAFTEFSDVSLLPKGADLYWDPRAAGGAAPFAGTIATPKPLVVTVHGAAPFSVAAREYFPDWRSGLKGRIANYRHLRGWREFRGRHLSIITVSNYAETEIRRYLRLGTAPIDPIYHGVDQQVFRPATNGDGARAPLFLHVSQYQPKKNVDVLIEAHQLIEPDRPPELVLVCPGYQPAKLPIGVKLISQGANAAELAKLYRSATAFVFPSLHETFGMPILEAMASGCPVITSNVTACPEVAGDAALLVDPRSVREIADAMRRLASDSTLRSELRNRGLARAAKFTWRASAEQHLAVFERAIREQDVQ